jgi:hypothetical protein
LAALFAQTPGFLAHDHRHAALGETAQEHCHGGLKVIEGEGLIE